MRLQVSLVVMLVLLNAVLISGCASGKVSRNIANTHGGDIDSSSEGGNQTILVSNVCKGAQDEAVRAYTAAVANTQQHAKRYNFKGRTHLQVNAIKNFWKKMTPDLRSDLGAVQQQGLAILQDSSLSDNQKREMFKHNRELLYSQLSAALKIEGYNREPGMGRNDQSIHMGFLGLGMRIGRTAELTTTSATDPTAVSLCVSTAEVVDNCEILSCPGYVSGSTAKSCLDLSTGRMTGTDPESACALGSCGPIPVEADFVAQYIQTNYPDCVNGTK